jgi:hypothetical protein
MSYQAIQSIHNTEQINVWVGKTGFNLFLLLVKDHFRIHEFM